MKFSITSTIASLALVASATATTHLNPRSLEVVTRVMTGVVEQIAILDTAVGAYNGGDPGSLVAACSTMVKAAQAADAEVLVMTPITSVDEAMQFQPLSDKLGLAGDSLLTRLESKVPVIEASGHCPQVLAAFSQLGDTVVKLMNDVADKFPKSPEVNSSGEIDYFQAMFARVADKLRACDASVVPCNSTSAVFTISTASKSAGFAVPTASTSAGFTVATARPTGVAPVPSVSVKGHNGTATVSAKVPHVTAGASAAGIARGALALFVAALVL